ncbi:MAG TPA: DnaJ domain-containing protein [Vicinamibacterales bacterium]|nr:DnaJ domain-containing protein [Vicinamibacterales bacterium]
MKADAVARAYAVLGLRPGCSRRDIKQQYKAMVRKWHPDRYAGDAVGFVEATAHMRRINEAFATLVDAARVREATPPPRTAPDPAPPTSDPAPPIGRPLTAAEIDVIAKAIGSPDPIGAALDTLGWWAPLTAAAFMLLPQGMRSPSWSDWMWAVVFAATAFGLKFRRRKKRRL